MATRVNRLALRVDTPLNELGLLSTAKLGLATLATVGRLTLAYALPRAVFAEVKLDEKLVVVMDPAAV